MKRRIIIALSSSILLLSGITSQASEERIKILRMGDSITRYVACNYDLKTGLEALGVDYVFVGSQYWTDTRMPPRKTEGHNGEVIDFFTTLQSEYGGKTRNKYQVGDVHTNSVPVQRACEAYEPDIILLMVGTNNLSSSHEPNYVMLKQSYAELLDQIQRYAPDAHTIVATVLPSDDAHEYNKIPERNTRHAAFNEQVVIPLVRERMQLGQPVSCVDVYGDIDPSSDLTDTVHPNAAGQAKVNAKWLEGIRAHLKL